MKTKTEILAQYDAAKLKYPKHLLLFKIGDFYELFNDDAQTISRVLGLTLLNRAPKGEKPIPMAGIPCHSAEAVLE